MPIWVRVHKRKRKVNGRISSSTCPSISPATLSPYVYRLCSVIHINFLKGMFYYYYFLRETRLLSQIFKSLDPLGQRVQNIHATTEH